MISRFLLPQVQRVLRRGKSVLLLGPRQTGKTTLIRQLQPALSLSFMLPGVRLRFERDADLLLREIDSIANAASQPPLIVLDEVQRYPACLDIAQDIIDRGLAQFVLTGSSARKLRRGSAINLLPGRVVVLRLDPLLINEMPLRRLEDWLLDGGLPGLITLSAEDCDTDLASYVETYLNEEVRAEALVRQVALFSRFLQLAAIESGKVLNFSKLGQDLGVSPPTLRRYFEILEDCLLAQRIEAFDGASGRRRLVKNPKFLLFDMGVRRHCADEPRALHPSVQGAWFEQFIGLQLLSMLRLQGKRAALKFWRDHDGPEVDWVIESRGQVIPIEVKWHDAPTPRDAKHLRTFMHRYPAATQGFVVCRAPRPATLAPHIEAIPWQQLQRIPQALN